jgi:hypothetical protein
MARTRYVRPFDDLDQAVDTGCLAYRAQFVSQQKSGSTIVSRRM